MPEITRKPTPRMVEQLRVGAAHKRGIISLGNQYDRTQEGISARDMGTWVSATDMGERGTHCWFVITDAGRAYLAKLDGADDKPQHDVVITRAKLYPEVAHPGPAWRWSYTYTVDGGPNCQYGPGLESLRDMLRRKFGTSGREAWKPQGGAPGSERMVATCCSCGADIKKPMDGPRPACTHDGETRPNGGVVVAGYVVRPADRGTCDTDRHHVTGVDRWTTRNTVPRCAECVAFDLGVSVDALPVPVVRLVQRFEERGEFPAADGERGYVRRAVGHVYSDGTKVRFVLDVYSDGERSVQVTRYAADHVNGESVPSRRRATWWGPSVAPDETRCAVTLKEVPAAVMPDSASAPADGRPFVLWGWAGQWSGVAVPLRVELGSLRECRARQRQFRDDYPDALCGIYARGDEPKALMIQVEERVKALQEPAEESQQKG